MPTLKSAAVFVADGTEELEAVTVIDILRRASIQVHVVSIYPGLQVNCSRNVKLLADCSLERFPSDPLDLYVLPGGQGGMEEFCASKDLISILQRAFSSGKYVAAICASPMVFKEANMAFGFSITSYPCFRDDLSSMYDYQGDRDVIVDRNLITSRGPGTAIPFALKLAELLAGREVSSKVGKDMLVS